MKHAIDPTLIPRSGADSSVAGSLCQARFCSISAGRPGARTGHETASAQTPTMPWGATDRSVSAPCFPYIGTGPSDS